MTDLVTCEHCGTVVSRKRRAQRYCSKQCSVAAAVARHRRKSVGHSPSEVLTESPPIPSPIRSAYSGPAPATAAPTVPSNPVREFAHGPTPGALQGDDWPLEYYEDGYPKLPACLDRLHAEEVTRHECRDTPANGHQLFNEVFNLEDAA
jgi:hypothetical protein